MTGKAKLWRKRVREWRASGLTSEQFSEGRGFRAGLLRNWAFRLGESQPRKVLTPELRMARVVPTAAPRAAAAVEPAGGTSVSDIASEAAALVVELGQARVSVRPGFDRAALAAVLEVIAQAGAR